MHDRLEEWLEESLSEAEAEEFEAHLAACAECRREAERARTLTRLAASLPAPAAPDSVAEGLRDRLARRRAPRLLRPVTVLAFAALAAAILLIVLPKTPTIEPPAPAPLLAGVTATVLFDWLDQARHSTTADAARLVEEAKAMELWEALRRKIAAAPAGDREGLLAFEDMLTQLLASPSPENLAEEAKLVALMVNP